MKTHRADTKDREVRFLVDAHILANFKKKSSRIIHRPRRVIKITHYENNFE